MSIFDILRARKIASMQRRKQGWLETAERHRCDAFELSLKAYHMDQFATPMAWGRTQNAANWEKHRERTARQKADELQTQIDKTTGVAS